MLMKLTPGQFRNRVFKANSRLSVLPADVIKLMFQVVDTVFKRRDTLVENTKIGNGTIPKLNLETCYFVPQLIKHCLKVDKVLNVLI